jgi:translocator protein
MTDRPDLRARLPRLLGSLLLPAIAAAVGGAATSRSVDSWYRSLRKPSFNPPSSVFGPVWTVLYILMGIADHLVDISGEGEGQTHARRLYRLQLGLNSGWSALFFGLRSPGLALIEIVALWTAIVMTIRAFRAHSGVAALLLVPYLLWTTFAAVLNAAIWWKNRDTAQERPDD